ncbi:MAG: orotate phosphoribosyltransferase [Alphaproteobacteria bacterium]|nr:orotate phosphoribosyltransferase [Alphaproteobacteria bacterium]
MDKQAILSEFENAHAILRGHFILSSGLRSDTYMQCARVLMDAARADRLCKALAGKLKQELGDIQLDAVVAPAMGGVIVGYEMGRQLGVPSMFCERVEGMFTLRRGFEIAKGAKVLVVEDVVTTGKSSIETFECIRAYGGEVIAETCLIDRTNGSVDLGVPLISLMTLDIKTYDPANLPPELAAIPALKPGSRGLK